MLYFVLAKNSTSYINLNSAFTSTNFYHKFRSTHICSTLKVHLFWWNSGRRGEEGMKFRGTICLVQYQLLILKHIYLSGKERREGKKESWRALIHSLNATMTEAGLGLSKSPSWTAGTKWLEPLPLPPRIHISRYPKPETWNGNQMQALWCEVWENKVVLLHLG